MYIRNAAILESSDAAITKAAVSVLKDITFLVGVLTLLNFIIVQTQVTLLDN